MQTISIVTKQDLLDFKDEILKEIQVLLKGSKIRKEEWLKSSEVQDLLKISAGTLQYIEPYLLKRLEVHSTINIRILKNFSAETINEFQLICNYKIKFYEY